MRLLDRMATLLKADAHGVVDALEERSLLVKQHLREAELELLQKRARSSALADEEKRLGDELERLRDELRSADEDVSLALAGGKDELARFAIRRLLPLRKQVLGLEAQRAGVADARADLAERLEAQEAQFEELRQRVRTHLAGVASAGELPEVPPVEEQEVELELLRRSGEARR